jgi:hypothetical protein
LPGVRYFYEFEAKCVEIGGTAAVRLNGVAIPALDSGPTDTTSSQNHDAGFEWVCLGGEGGPFLDAGANKTALFDGFYFNGIGFAGDVPCSCLSVAA